MSGRWTGQSVQGPIIERALAEDLEQYKGRWVAVDQGRLVADGGSAIEVRDSARAKGVTDPLIFRVPMNPDRARFALVDEVKAGRERDARVRALHWKWREEAVGDLSFRGGALRRCADDLLDAIEGDET